MSDSDDIELTPTEETYLEWGIVKDSPYPEMMEYFKRIANKLLNNPNVNEIGLINKRSGKEGPILNEKSEQMHLSDFAGKVNFMFSNDPKAVFIFASNSNGEPVRVNEDTNINDLNWNIVLNPVWLVELFEEKGETFTEDHLAAAIGHELSHMWNRIEGTTFGGKKDEEEADIKSMKLLAMAGYNPGACSNLFANLPKPPRDTLSIILEPHLDSEKRKEVLKIVELKLTSEQGTNYSSKLERKFTQIEPKVQACINKEKAALATQREVADFIENDAKTLEKRARAIIDGIITLEDTINNTTWYLELTDNTILLNDSFVLNDDVKKEINEVNKELLDFRRQNENNLREYYKFAQTSNEDVKPRLKKLGDVRLKALKAEQLEFKTLRTTDESLKNAVEKDYIHQKQRVFEEFEELEPYRRDIRKSLERLIDPRVSPELAAEHDKLLREINEYKYDSVLSRFKSSDGHWIKQPEELTRISQLCNDEHGCHYLLDKIKQETSEKKKTLSDYFKKAYGLWKRIGAIEEKIASPVREFLGSDYNELDADTVLKLYPLVNNLRENFNDENLLKYVRYANVSPEVKKNEIKHCCEENGKITRSSTTYKDWVTAMLLVSFAIQKTDDVGKELLEVTLFDKIDHEKDKELVYSLLPKILKNRNNYPDDFYKCLTLYKFIYYDYERLSTTDITIVQSEVLKRFLSLKDDDEIIKNSLSLLNKECSFTDDVLRDKLFEAFTDAVLRKYGKDDGSKVYKEKIYDFICELKKVDMAQFDKENIARKITDKLETKRLLSEVFYDFSESGLSNKEIENALDAGAVFTKLIKDGCIKDDQIIDFLQNDFSYQKALGLQEIVPIYYRENFISGAYQFHQFYWGCSLKQRAAILSQVLSDERKKDTEGLFKYAILRVLPPNIENRKVIEDVLFAYINAHKEDQRMFYLAALMAANKQSAVQVGKFNIGKPLKDFLENIGPAGIKLGQAIGSFPGTPAEIVASMQELKQDADPPARWELYEEIDIAGMLGTLDATVSGEKVSNYEKFRNRLQPARAERIKDFWGKGRDGLKDDDPDEVAKIGKVIGSGSYFITVDSNGRVLQVLRPYAAERAEEEFKILSNALETLSEKYSLFVASAKQIIGTAQNMVGIETDMNIAKEQIKTAEELYPKEPIRVAANGKHYSCLFKVAKWIEGGLGYKTVEKVDGIHFNDMPSSPLKTEIAKLYLRQELKNIMSGGKFDHDRHGAQIKIDVDEKNSAITLGIFDNGAMSVDAPDEASKRSLSEIFNMTIDMAIASFMQDRKVDVVSAFTTAITEYLNKQEKTNIKDISESDQKSRDYILSVQRGLLALNDFMREVDQIDLLSLFVEAFANADKDILGSMSENRKYLLKGSAPIIKGYANLNNIYAGLHKKVETFTKRLQGQEAKGSSVPVETSLDKDIREINEREDIYFRLMSSKEAKDIGLCEDINDNLHDINNIPEGTVFNVLDLSGMDFTELPEVLSTCTVRHLKIDDCENLTSLKNLPKGLEALSCRNTNIISLEECSKEIEYIFCSGCDNIKYIPDYIFDEAISGLTEEQIAECKANWKVKSAFMFLAHSEQLSESKTNLREENKETILDTAKDQSLPKENLADELRHTLKSRGPKAAFNLFKKINGRGKESSVVLEINTPFSSKEGKKKSIKDILSLRKKGNRDA